MIFFDVILTILVANLGVLWINLFVTVTMFSYMLLPGLTILTYRFVVNDVKKQQSAMALVKPDK